MTDNSNMKNKPFIKNFFQLGELGGYFFRKKEPKGKASFSLKMMHGVNKFSAIIFIIGVIYLILKYTLLT